MASTSSLSSRWKWAALLWGAWRAMTSELSGGRTELFVTLEYHFSFSHYWTQFTHSKKKFFNMLEGFSKYTALLHFQSILWTWQQESVTGLLHCMMEGACSLQALQQDNFQKQQQIWEQKALRKMSNAERKGRDFCGTRPKLQLFMKINRVWMWLSLDGERLCVWKSACPSLIAVPREAAVTGLSTVSAVEFRVKQHQPENYISPG